MGIEKKKPEEMGKETIEAIDRFAKANGLTLEQVLLNHWDYLVEDPSHPGSFVLSTDKVRKSASESFPF